MGKLNITDHQLMSDLGQGHLWALDVLVERYQQRVIALAFRLLGNWHYAEDVAQDTFLRLYNAAPNYRPDAKLITFIYKIVINLCRDHQRKESQAKQLDEQAEIISYADCPDDSALRKEQASIVKQAVLALPERQKDAVILHRFEGLSHAEVAEVMGISVSAAESLLVRAYASLRNSLAKFNFNAGKDQVVR